VVVGPGEVLRSLRADCSEPMPKGTTVAYNHHERRALCEVCCEREGHVPQLSAAAKNLRRDAA
jgi:hypothetical protein